MCEYKQMITEPDKWYVSDIGPGHRRSGPTDESCIFRGRSRMILEGPFETEKEANEWVLQFVKEHLIFKGRTMVWKCSRDTRRRRATGDGA